MKTFRLFFIVIACLIGQAFVLYLMGQHAFCECGIIRLWSTQVVGPENSQQFFDPYTLSHISHGIIFFFLLSWWDIPLWKKVLIALGLEISWELLENTPIIIDRYRAATISLGYYGDSILNSVMDSVAAIIGFYLAYIISKRWLIILLLIALEVISLWWIRDSLLINIIMLIYPLEIIKIWQGYSS